MNRYVVTRLNAVMTPAGPVLDRIAGDGWMETPDTLIAHLVNGQHRFPLANSDCAMAVRRNPRGDWILVVEDGNGQQISPSSLPHWHIETPRAAPRRGRSLWQRLLNPDAA